MNWLKKIRSILGYFWCEFWDDSWLVLLIVKLYKFIVGETIESRLQQICKQTSVFLSVDADYIYPIKVLISRAYQPSTLSVSLLNIGSSVLGLSDSGYLYDVHSYISKDTISIKPSVLSLKLLYDFVYYPNSKKLFSSIDLLKNGFTAALLNVNGLPTLCIVLWASCKQFNTLRDIFSAVLLLPIYWLYKYPGILPTAWKIKHTGATTLLVKLFFSAMGITALVYSGSLPLPSDSIVPGIYVFTLAGYLYASNLTASLYDDCIPLKTSPTGAISSAYITKCHLLLDSDIFVLLPVSLNPAKYIFLKLWHSSASLIIVLGTADLQDMNIAMLFIAKNIVKGAILQIYKKLQGSLLLLYPDKDKVLTLLSYYNNSINNTLTYSYTLL